MNLTRRIVLRRTASWSGELYGDRDLRYAEVDGRRFRAERERQVWYVWEVGEDGQPDPDNLTDALFATAFTHDDIRLSIDMRVNGNTHDEIWSAIIGRPRRGTGRNHPDNVARRRRFT